MKTIVQKLTSRKLWLAIAGVATGIALALGANASDIQSVAGAVTAIVSAVVYIVTEGKIDAARVATAITATEGAVETVTSKDAETKGSE